MNRPGGRALVVAAALLGVMPFLLTAPACGLYLDDYSFLRMLEGISPGGLWLAFLHYVPGRNLHIPFFYALLELTGRSVPAMHAVGLAFDALNAALLFLLVRRLTGLRSIALAAAAIFAAAPNHGETHFWITLIAQCQIPTALTLAAFLLAARGRLLPACAVYAVALFTYDQVFFLWPLLLAVAWNRDPAPRRARYASAAAALLAMNVAHIALRYLSPYASGGRPTIRVEDFFHRCRDVAVAVGKGVIPLPTVSRAYWAWSLPVIALALAGSLWLLRAVRREAANEREELAGWWDGSGWRIAAAAGAAWTALAYLPILFWYLSPRHNLLPSIGWAVSLASIGAGAVSRSRRAAAVLPGLACLYFAAAAVFDFHEGTQWVESRRLRDSFAEAVRRLPAPVDAVFVVGAPRYLSRAPAFNLPHDVTMAASRALGRGDVVAGDYQVAPTRRGVVYRNDLSIGPAEDFRWLPAGEANVLFLAPPKRAFACASSLRVDGPAGPSRNLPLRPNADCTAVLPVTADAVLDASTPGAPRPAAAGPRAGGLALLSAAVIPQAETTKIELEWRVEKTPQRTLAFIPRLKDADGRLLLDAVFPSRGGQRPYPMIWPLVDDLAPGLHLKSGQTLSQSFTLRRASKALPAGAVLELAAFEIAPAGDAVPLGTLTAPVPVKP